MLADEHSAGGQTDEGIVRALQVGTATVARVRRRLVEHGLEAALNRQVQRNRRAKKLDGEGEAFLVATACSAPPEGRGGSYRNATSSARWKTWRPYERNGVSKLFMLCASTTPGNAIWKPGGGAPDRRAAMIVGARQLAIDRAH